MQGMNSTKRTIFFKFQFIWSFSFVFCSRIIPISTLFTGQSYDITHFRTLSTYQSSRSCLSIFPMWYSWIFHSPYSTISLMTPAPTVRPPSRMANRSSFSIAMGVIKLTSIDTLSPGITISTPSGNVTTPVTSVVRK